MKYHEFVVMCKMVNIPWTTENVTKNRWLNTAYK